MSTAAATTPAPATPAPSTSGVGYYVRCALAGAVCCSLTHSAVVPIDVVKTRLQLRPGYYSGMMNGFSKIVAEEGAATLLTGLAPTAVGYFAQGALKFGFYEVFKKTFYNALGNETADKYRTWVYLGASGSAEVLADLALCPMEATRIRLVQNPAFATSLPDAAGKILAAEGIMGFYKGLPPILLKQVPYTMAKFAVFERVAEFMWGFAPKDASGGTELAISLGGGLVAGFVAAVISQPADTVLSVINKNKSDAPMFTAIGRILTELGPRKLFLGLGTRIVMVGSLTAGQFLIYDYIKQIFGLPTTAKRK